MKTTQETFLDDTERWPVEKLDEFQWRKLQALVKYAYLKLPFYHQLYDKAGIKLRDIKRIQDFSRLPIVRKPDIMQARQSSDSFLTGMEVFKENDSATLGMTSGTTGTDFLYCSRRWRRYQGGRLLRAYWWAGLRPGMSMMLTVPAWHCWAAEESYLAQRLGVVGVVPWGTFLPRFAGNILDTILDLHPEFISMFLPMLYALQAECNRRGLELRQAFTGVRCILVVGAPLTPASRQKLQEEFGTDVYAGAGTTEGLIAMECSEHRGYHLFVDTCYLEVVNPTDGNPVPPGERGLLLLTAFNPYGTVYIRFDTGDLGRINPEPCPCGRSWHRIEIYDRLANTFSVQDKKLVPYDVRLCLDEIPELTGMPFSVIRQIAPTDYIWLALQKPLATNLAHLEAKLKEVIRQKLQVAVKAEWVEELPVRWKGAPVIEEAEWRGDRCG